MKKRRGGHQYSHTIPLRKKRRRRRRTYFITDKRHFAGVKAVRTKRINETVRRIKEARRTHFPAANYAMNETYEQMFLADVAGILEEVL